MLAEPVAEAGERNGFQQFRFAVPLGEPQFAAVSIDRQRRGRAVQFDLGRQSLAEKRGMRKQERTDCAVLQFKADARVIKRGSFC